MGTTANMATKRESGLEFRLALRRRAVQEEEESHFKIWQEEHLSWENRWNNGSYSLAIASCYSCLSATTSCSNINAMFFKVISTQ